MRSPGLPRKVVPVHACSLVLQRCTHSWSCVLLCVVPEGRHQFDTRNVRQDVLTLQQMHLNSSNANSRTIPFAGTRVL
jgi:hypothetical protein